MFLDPVPPSLVDPLLEPPKFDDLSSSRECPWGALDYLGIMMLGSLSTAAILLCIWAQRKFQRFYAR